MIMTCGAVQSSFYSDMKWPIWTPSITARQKPAIIMAAPLWQITTLLLSAGMIIMIKTGLNMCRSMTAPFCAKTAGGKISATAAAFYISYEDTNIGRNNMVYTKVEDADNYDKIYQTDRLGWIGAIGYNEPEAYFANKYSADGITLDRVLSCVFLCDSA